MAKQSGVKAQKSKQQGVEKPKGKGRVSEQATRLQKQPTGGGQAVPDKGRSGGSKPGPQAGSKAKDSTAGKKRPLEAVPAAAAAHQQAAGDLTWPYPTDYLDHFETSEQALVDIEPLLYRLASHLGKTKAELAVYDPYYCNGAIRKHYEKLGFKSLRHEKRDFYADIEAGTVPQHDILITNPPYSADHKERILQFCASSGKPWALLMPNYVANKQYFQDVADSAAGSHAPFFLVPSTKYEYMHPEGTGHGSSPFFSIWFVHLGENTARVANWLEKLQGQRSKKGGEASGVKMLRSISDLQENAVVPTWTRPNPRQRKKLKKQKQEEA